MHHILRAITVGSCACDGTYEHGYFQANDLEEALKCAKAHISAWERTLVEVIPFGRRRSENGDFIGEHSPMVVWEHDPHECQKTLARGAWTDHKCEVCEKYLAEEAEAEKARAAE